MTTKRTTYFLASAIAMLSLALPAGAAANWTHSTAPLEASAEISRSGSYAFTGGLGGTTCGETNTTSTLTPGSSADTTGFSASIASCSTSGLLAGCTLTSITPTNLPWVEHTNTISVTMTNVKVDFTYHGAFCPYHIITLKGEQTIFPKLGQSHALREGTIGGNATAYNGTTTAHIQTTTWSGTHFWAPAGTYGIT